MSRAKHETLINLSATELASLIAKGDVSSQEVVEKHIERIEKVNPVLNAVVVPMYESARREAKEADKQLSKGQKLGPLHGVPITVKECLEIAGTPSTFGVAARKNTLSKQDDIYVTQMRAAGAVILGKTNVAQCLLYFESENPAYGRTNNPWDKSRTCGGSSGGEGAIIGAGGSPLGLGTDIGGSLRIPATFCGITSLKPTSGRTPDPGRYSLPIGQRAVVSQVGVLARHVSDVSLGTQIINNINIEPPIPFGDYASVDVSKLNVAYYTHDGTMTVAPAVKRAVEAAAAGLKKQGIKVSEWTPPATQEAVHIYFGLLSGDGGKGFGRAVNDGNFDPRVKTLATLAGLPTPLLALAKGLLKIIGQPTLGNFLDHFGYTSVDKHWQLVEAQMNYQERFKEALDKDNIDVILAPACALPAFTHGASNDLGVCGAYTMLYNLLGYPAGVVPFTRVQQGEEVGRKASGDKVEQAALKVETASAGLPVGIQVIARPWREHIALAIMNAIEQFASKNSDYPKERPS